MLIPVVAKSSAAPALATSLAPPFAHPPDVFLGVVAVAVAVVKGRKRHLLEAARDSFPRLSHMCFDAACNDLEKGAVWVEKVLSWSAEIVRHPRKLVPEEVMRIWANEWAKEGVVVDWKRLLPEEGPRPFLPKRWIVKRSFAWVSHNRRMSKDYERLCTSGEAFVYAAMSRLMLRRLVRS